MLFHGLHKLFDGIDGISNMLIAKGLPGFIAYGVLVGEVIAPCLIVLGILTRPAALVLALTMVVAWLMVGTGKTWQLDAVGAWADRKFSLFLYWRAGGGVSGGRGGLCCGKFGLAVKNCRMAA
ncbi:DoxX [Citrobacter koseri]|nr:DoxX [Citrobacter koseri]